MNKKISLLSIILGIGGIILGLFKDSDNKQHMHKTIKEEVAKQLADREH